MVEPCPAARERPAQATPLIGACPFLQGPQCLALPSLRSARRHGAIGLHYPQSPAPNCARSRRAAVLRKRAGVAKLFVLGEWCAQAGRVLPLN